MFLADFSRKKKVSLTPLPEEEKRKKTKDWNNWEKAREIRSGVSTGQRLSQDVRGWLNMAQRLRG
jgi:hypothetical protein